jgi:hypothetical protein
MDYLAKPVARRRGAGLGRQGLSHEKMIPKRY